MRLVWCTVLLQALLVAASTKEFGFLRVRTNDGFDKTFGVGIAQFSKQSFPSSSKDDGNWHRIVKVSPQDGCTAFETNVVDSYALVMRGNCSFANKTEQAARAGAFGIIVINTDNSYFVMGSDSPVDKQIESVMVASKDGKQINDLENPRAVTFVPERGWGSMIALWFMAVGTVTVGSLWAAPSDRRSKTPQRLMESMEPENPTVEVTAYAAGGFIVVASLALVVLFFFMKILVVVVIVMFCIGSSSALYQVTYSILIKFNAMRRSILVITRLDVPCFGICNLLNILVSVLSIGFAVWFFVERHQRYSWFMQDVLGISLCLVFLKTFKFPNMKISALLLILAFLYDIFWVFISPYLFKGRSVMVTVATGGGSKESIPMLLRFPNFCEGCSDALLGLGDIVLPGLFVSFTLAFDRAKSLSLFRGYFLYCVFGYSIGLLFTYFALMVMQKGQPALLYLVPCTLGLVSVIAFCRGHLQELWTGPAQSEQTLIGESSVSDQGSEIIP